MLYFIWRTMPKGYESALPGIFRLFWIPPKSLGNKATKRILAKFSYPKKSRNNPGIKNFKPIKILRSSPSLEIRSTPYGFLYLLKATEARQGFRLRPEGGRFVWSFAILCPLLWCQFLRVFNFFNYHFFYLSNPWTYCHSPPLPFRLLNCPTSLKILLFRENLSELQPCLGNWFLGPGGVLPFQKRWKQRFWVFCFKNSLEEHAPDPPR